MATDTELMNQVKAGDVHQLGSLFERYKQALFSYFFKVCKGDTSSAEDLVQTVFYKVLKYRENYKGHGSFKGWLFRIAHNTSLDFHRKKKYELSFEEEEAAHPLEEACDRTIIHEEELQMLQTALERLDYEQREILSLAKIKSLKYQEIAEILDLSEGNVKVRIFRAMKALKEEYQLVQKTH